MFEEVNYNINHVLYPLDIVEMWPTSSTIANTKTQIRVLYPPEQCLARPVRPYETSQNQNSLEPF